MQTLGSDLEGLRKQLEDGSVQRAYVAILGYMSRLRAWFASGRPDQMVSDLYQGVFDMTYFALTPPALKARELKLAIVFDYSSFRFQVWLAARNRNVQRRYWELLRDNGWTSYPLLEPAAGVDAITVDDIANGLELEHPERLTAEIESAVSAFGVEVERFLADCDPRSV
jgi:hypothetical protein